MKTPTAVPGVVLLFAAALMAGTAAKPLDGNTAKKLLADMRSKDRSAGAKAATELQRHRDAASIQVLLSLLADADPVVRADAAGGLGLLRAKEALQPLVQAMEADTDPFVRQQAAQFLGNLDDLSAADALLRVVQNEKESDSLRVSACNSLGRLKAVAAVPVLVDLLKNNALSFRRTVVVTLGRVGGPSAIEPLRLLLDDSDPVVQRASVMALGRLQDAASVPRFKKNLGPQNPTDIRAASAMALMALGDESGRPVLLEVLKDPKAEKHMRLQVLGHLLKEGDGAALRRVSESMQKGASEDEINALFLAEAEKIK